MIALWVDLEYHRLVEIAAGVADGTFLIWNLVCVAVSISWLAHVEVCHVAEELTTVVWRLSASTCIVLRHLDD